MAVAGAVLITAGSAPFHSANTCLHSCVTRAHTHARTHACMHARTHAARVSERERERKTKTKRQRVGGGRQEREKREREERERREREREREGGRERPTDTNTQRDAQTQVSHTPSFRTIWLRADDTDTRPSIFICIRFLHRSSGKVASLEAPPANPPMIDDGSTPSLPLPSLPPALLRPAPPAPGAPPLAAPGRGADVARERYAAFKPSKILSCV